MPAYRHSPPVCVWYRRSWSRLESHTYTVSKKRHWCCTLQLQCTSTHYGNFWHRYCWGNMLSNCDLLSHFSWLMFLHYLRKYEHQPRKLSFQSYLENDTALAGYMAISSTFINQF